MNYRAKEEEGDPSEINNSRKSSNISSSSRQWANFKNPRIVRVSRTFGGKDRHSKVCTVRGLRDRRIRLSVPTAIQLYDLQDRLGLSQPSKVVDWLLDATKSEIDKLPPLQMPPGGSFMNPHFFQPPLPLPLPLPATDTVSHHHHHSQEEKNQEEPFQEQNFFPLGNHEEQQQQQQQPSFPFINPYYQHHLELPAAAFASYNLSLSQFGNQYSSFPIQLPPAAHEPAAADHNSQLYFCPSAAPPPPFPILNNNNNNSIPPQYIMPSGSGGPVEFLTSSSNTTTSSSNQNVVVPNSFMPTLHHLIGGGSPMMMKSSSLTLNVNNNNYYPKVILHPQETDSNRREKGEETGT